MPEIMRDVKPEAAATAPLPIAPKPPVIAAPKDVETPAEPRAVAKPELPPVLPPAKPAATDELPVFKSPPKPADAKPAPPEKAAPEKPAPEKPAPEKKDDPFGTSNDVKTMRQWTDASGKFHIEARFVSFQDGTVRLQKADGRYFRVKYDRLCAGDQDFVLHQDGALFAAE